MGGRCNPSPLQGEETREWLLAEMKMRVSFPASGSAGRAATIVCTLAAVVLLLLAVVVQAPTSTSQSLVSFLICVLTGAALAGRAQAAPRATAVVTNQPTPRPYGDGK